MLLGVSHIVLYSTDFDRDLAALSSWGYTEAFRESDHPCAREKSRLVQGTPAAMSLVYLEAPRQLGIELVHYDSAAVNLGQAGSYRLYLSAGSSDGPCRASAPSST